MEEFELALAKGVERMETICSISMKRITVARKKLGIPDQVSREEYLVYKSPDNIELVTNTVHDVNRMLNNEILGIGVRVAMSSEIQSMVDAVRNELAILIDILAKGMPKPQEEVIEEEPSVVPKAILVATIVTCILAVVMIFVAVDSDK